MDQELINQTQTMLADPGIPAWAKIFGALMSVLVIGGSAWLGRKRSTEPAAVTDGKSVVLEGALVDSASIKILSGSVEALGVSIKTAEMVLQKNTDVAVAHLEALRRAHDVNNKTIDALEEVAEQLDRQRQSRDELTHEMRELRVQMGIWAATMRNHR